MQSGRVETGAAVAAWVAAIVTWVLGVEHVFVLAGNNRRCRRPGAAELQVVGLLDTKSEVRAGQRARFRRVRLHQGDRRGGRVMRVQKAQTRSEEHTSELQSL